MKRLSKSDPMVLCYMEDTASMSSPAAASCTSRSASRISRRTSWAARWRSVTPSCPTASPAREVQPGVPLQVREQAQPPLRHRGAPRRRVLCGHRIVQDRPRGDPKPRGRYIADTHGWDVTEARKIWAFGPDTNGPNVFMDQTKALTICWRSRSRSTMACGLRRPVHS